jgi:hypothetical protein
MADEKTVFTKSDFKSPRYLAAHAFGKKYDTQTIRNEMIKQFNKNTQFMLNGRYPRKMVIKKDTTYYLHPEAHEVFEEILSKGR